ncbi:hypothetical protein AB0B51_13035, partial [Streptomyces griseus]|uniref:hypothetical protein n=1 Tax=Streptomyces griseus TaxID=1911 RepID=UPI0033F77C60
MAPGRGLNGPADGRGGHLIREQETARPRSPSNHRGTAWRTGQWTVRRYDQLVQDRRVLAGVV